MRRGLADRGQALHLQRLVIDAAARELSDRADPATELVAGTIVELAERGERDPARLRDQVVKSLSK
jgi:hypothetical protein